MLFLQIFALYWSLVQYKAMDLRNMGLVNPPCPKKEDTEPCRKKRDTKKEDTINNNLKKQHLLEKQQQEQKEQKNVVVFFEKEKEDDKKDGSGKTLILELEKIGFSRRNAEVMLKQYPSEKIKKTITYVTNHGDIKNKAGFIVKALKDSYILSDSKKKDKQDQLKKQTESYLAEIKKWRDESCGAEAGLQTLQNIRDAINARVQT